MLNFFKILLIAVILLVVVVGVMILLGWGLSLIIAAGVPCALMLYVTTGLLFGIFLLVAYLLSAGMLQIKK